MEIEIGGGIGDQLALTGTIREYARAYPDENIRLWRSKAPDLWRGNPRINRGNRENGKRVRLNFFSDLAMNFPRDYAQQIIKATGDFFEIENDSPEIFLSPDEINAGLGVEVKEKALTIDTWAGWENRRWAYDRYVRLAKELLRRGWQVIEIGGGRKREKYEETNPIPCSTSVFGLHKIRETAALLKRVRLHVGNDSGMFHLAAAVGTPQVTLFGLVPWYKRAYSTTTPVSPKGKCGPCNWGGCYRKTFCMDEIEVDDVLKVIR